MGRIAYIIGYHIGPSVIEDAIPGSDEIAQQGAMEGLGV
jgi:hypothetical protein